MFSLLAWFMSLKYSKKYNREIDSSVEFHEKFSFTKNKFEMSWELEQWKSASKKNQYLPQKLSLLNISDQGLYLRIEIYWHNILVIFVYCIVLFQ